MTSDQALKHPFMQLAVDRRDSKYVAAYFEANRRLNSHLSAASRSLVQTLKAVALLQFVRAVRPQVPSLLLDSKLAVGSCPSSPLLSKQQQQSSNICRVLDNPQQHQRLYFIKSTRKDSSPQSLHKLTSRVMEHTESSNSKLKPNLSATRRALEQKFKSHQVHPTVSKFQLKYIGLSKEKIRRESPTKLQTSVDTLQKTRTNASPLPDIASKREELLARLAKPEAAAAGNSESGGSPNRSLHLPKRASRSIDFDKQLEQFIKSPADLRPLRELRVNKVPPAILPVLPESKQIDRSSLADSHAKYIRIRRSASHKGR